MFSMDRIKSRLDKIEARLDDLENRILKIEITLENVISKKLDLIIEILSGVIDKQERYDIIETTIEIHENRISALENYMKKHNADFSVSQ